jgi:hypothetical protein
MEVLPGSVIAVIISASKNKPHFAGAAYVRIGSTTCKASEAMFEDLITSRTGVGQLLLKLRDDGAELYVDKPYWQADRKHYNRLTCTVAPCDPYQVLFRIVPGNEFSLPINELSARFEGSAGKYIIREKD